MIHLLGLDEAETKLDFNKTAAVVVGMWAKRSFVQASVELVGNPEGVIHQIHTSGISTTLNAGGRKRLRGGGNKR